jgi:hypothetical protein
MKYEIIDDLDTNNNILIYGDEGWAKVFPQYFQNKYLVGAEQKELFTNGRALHLQFNMGSSYLYPSGSVIDSIINNIPFINYAPVVKTSGFQGFEFLEYKDKESLNSLVDNINVRLKDPMLEGAISNCLTSFTGSTHSLNHQILFDCVPQDDKGYSELRLETAEMLDTKVQEYIAENEDSINLCFQELFLEDNFDFNIKTSRYYNRDFFQKIIS